MQYICTLADKFFTFGAIYTIVQGEDNCLIDNQGDFHGIALGYRGIWEASGDNSEFKMLDGSQVISVDSLTNTTESVQIATLRSIQEQCSRANLSISIDPEGFNIFDCDTDMQTMVHSVADAVEILETKLEYKDSMGKWGWL